MPLLLKHRKSCVKTTFHNIAAAKSKRNHHALEGERNSSLFEESSCGHGFLLQSLHAANTKRRRYQLWGHRWKERLVSYTFLHNYNIYLVLLGFILKIIRGFMSLIWGTFTLTFPDVWFQCQCRILCWNISHAYRELDLLCKLPKFKNSVPSLEPAIYVKNADSR